MAKTLAWLCGISYLIPWKTESTDDGEKKRGGKTAFKSIVFLSYRLAQSKYFTPCCTACKHRACLKQA